MRFPGFDGEWEELEVKNILKIGSGRDYKYLKNGNIPVFGTGGLMTTVDNYLYEGETICIGRKGTINKPFYYNGKIWTIDTLFYTHSFKKVIAKFVFNIFQKINWLQYNEASGVPSLSKSTIEKVQISIPNIIEQQKISSFLSLIDDRLELSMKIIEQLETLIKASREKLFSQKLRFKDEHGSDFLAWERKKIKEILTIGSGKDYKHLNDGTIPVYGTGGIITFVDSFLYDGETVCIGRKGTIDRPLYYNGKIWTVDTLFYTHSFNNSVPRFVFNIFQNINWKEYNEASGVPSLSKNTIEKIEILIPCLYEQYKIANFLSSIQDKIETEKKILEKLELQKKFFLANLFV